MKKLFAILTLSALMLVAGCSQVDKETQQFANRYNKQHVNMRIALCDLQEANAKMKISNGSAKTFAANEAMKIGKDFVAKSQELQKLETDPQYQKAKEAGLLKDYKGIPKQELVKIYMEMK